MVAGYQTLLDRAAACMGGEKKRALIVGGDNDAVLQSIAEWQGSGEGLSAVIVGDEKTIGDRMERLGVALPAAEFLQADSEDKVAQVAVSVASDADIIIKGQIHTDTFMRSMLSGDSGLRGEGGGLCSHVFYMMSDDFPHPYFLSDGALNLSPTGAVGEAILANMTALAEQVTGDFPHVAVLSATESVNPKIASTVEAERLVEWGRQELSHPDRIFGPVALDIAVSPEAAAVKGYTHPSAGQANALLVPSLEAGNILFKSWVRYNDAIAGGLVVGAKAPIVLTSRSDSVASRLASLALAVIASAE